MRKMSCFVFKKKEICIHFSCPEDTNRLCNLLLPPRVLAACAPAQLQYGTAVTLGQTAAKRAV